MSYLTDIESCWKYTLHIAEQGKCSELQLQAVRDLSEWEFGGSSNCRLKLDWRTLVDADGDLMLIFDHIEGDVYKKLLTISIDRDGILTTKDDESGEVEVWDPFENGWTSAAGELNPMWMLPERMLQKLTRPSIWYEVNESGSGALHVAENGRRYAPSYRSVHFTHVRHLGWWDGPLSGVGRLYGRLFYFALSYEDAVSRQRIFSMHALTRIDAARLWLNLLRTKVWSRAPRLYMRKFEERPLIGYFMR